MIHAIWSESERRSIQAFLSFSSISVTYYCQTGARWEATKAAETAKPTEPSGPLTTAEKAWFKQHFKDDDHFSQRYGLSLHKEDREKGRIILRILMADDASDGGKPIGTTGSYTTAEMAWLKQHFKDDDHFLRQYGLSIHKEEDREEGRAMLRAFMADDASDGGSSENDSDDDTNSFLDEMEDDPTSHVTNYNFTGFLVPLDCIRSISD